jgi:hypothetical protein
MVVLLANSIIGLSCLPFDKYYNYVVYGQNMLSICLLLLLFVSVIINMDNIIVIIVAFDINIIIVVFVTSSFLDQEKCLSAKL